MPGGWDSPQSGPAIYAVLANRERYGRFVVLYGARSPDEVLYARELRDWRGRFDVELEVTVDRSTPSWRGNVGVVSSLIARSNISPIDTVAFLCGPEIMMRFSAMELLGAGMAPERVYLSMERNMACGIGLCGHCQLGPFFVCKDGPVFAYDRVMDLMKVPEV